jgi:hypothetical protein
MGIKPRRGRCLASFERFLVKHGDRRVDPARIRREIPGHIEIPASVGSFLRSDELSGRYGVALPRALAELFGLADEIAIEDYRPELGWKYLRVGPGGWEPPTGEIGLPLLAEYVDRFEWNAFSNLQLWEAFAGVVCLGWHDDGNRLYASIVSGDEVPVLWMDHEYGVLGGYVATGLVELLDYCMGKAVASRVERALKNPHNRTFRSRQPPFCDPLRLQDRAHWIVALLAWGKGGVSSADRALEKDWAVPADYAREKGAMAATLASPCYWLFRTFLRREDELFEAALSDSEANPSPLVQSIRIVLPERAAEKPAKTFLAKMSRRYSKRR